MHVYALVGSSGTGKSHRAVRLAYELHCSIIIDDGLIIEENRILTGTSAKKAPSRLGAIRTALFQDDLHQQQCQEAIRQANPSGILILGTSDGMVNRIAERLGLPAPEKIIQIEDIASDAEIRKARYNRSQRGRHVVPAPALEVKKTWRGALIDPIRILFRKKGHERKTWTEQSVVRPTFTSLGNLSISTPAIIAAVTHQLQGMAGVHGIDDVEVDHLDEGMSLDVKIHAEYGIALHHLGHSIQQALRQVFDESIGVPVAAVNVTFTKLHLSDR
ncbi:Asp23/Gls24 family envelope stress response protein [Heliophilum fasciatum]|uniref:Putative alkaline shock family protein YloU n=1 Tax=Heliophilum fasciatum TaxID=35700 RepID=A0A4R2S4G2_9FIRM|nr:Asp23/Gls24 family envelope stress response protein [Heliophilum fasciatum]MCW2277405.1 putative alkaline shock family protein YloU [Heliophilum fasciatum]TCP67241.1 putative alkaline shock family protein YloU [Heliophilum fasciatum]